MNAPTPPVAIPYERPAIAPLRTGHMNKFGARPANQRLVRDRIEGATIDDLVARFGSPLFVFSEKRIRRACRRIGQAFTAHYAGIEMAWSYKTNYLSSVCRIMHQEGSLAEVVSAMEYEMARANGVPGDRIIFNGPVKSRAILSRAVREGATINVDHLDEIDDLADIAGELGRVIDIGLRVNLDAGILPQWSRFGFNLETGQAMQAAQHIAASGRLRLTGLHCHIGTYIMDPAAYEAQIAKLVAFGHELEDRFGTAIACYDLGGGLPSLSRLKGSYHPPSVTLPPIEEYAERIGAALARALRPGETPRVIIEPGRAVIDESAWLITTVQAAKRLANGTRAYVVDAGVNLLYTATWYRFTVEVDRLAPGLPELSVIYGPLCMNIDVVEEGLELPPLSRGHRLILSPVGAYNVTQWMQFIAYRPAIVMITEDGTVEPIRVAEGLDDVMRPMRLPAHLSEA